MFRYVFPFLSGSRVLGKFWTSVLLIFFFFSFYQSLYSRLDIEKRKIKEILTKTM